MITSILAAMGFEKSLIVRKRRSSYRLGRCRVELDEVPLLGKFIEVEGPSTAAVERAMHLGLTGERVTAGYVTMLAASHVAQGCHGGRRLPPCA